jgi:mRNA interferase RelE/StbE
MVSYKVEIKKSAQKEIRKLPNKDLREKIVNKINELYLDPTPDESKKIKGSDNIYRIRQGVYRIVYRVYKDKLIVMVIRVRHRKNAYQDL